jgi:hypothetical protein
MRSERLRRLLLESEQFRGLIEVFFAAFITSGRKTAVDSRVRGEGVRLRKRDSVPEKEILTKMEPMVLAVDYPKITAIFPHRSKLRAVTRRAGSSVPRMISNQVGQLPESFSVAEKSHSCTAFVVVKNGSIS